MNITINLDPQSVALMERMKTMPDAMLQGIKRGMDRATNLTTSDIQAKRLSGKGPFPVPEHRLGVVTNRLRSSLRASRAILIRTGNGGKITAGIGSNVRYAGVHEFGFDGEVEVQSFTRKNKRYDGYEIPTKKSSKRVKTASGISVVKTHRRMMHMPERAPIRTGIMDNRETFTRNISAALVAAWKGTTEV